MNAAYKNILNNDDAKRAVGLLYATALISSGNTPNGSAKLGNKIV